VAPIDAPTLQGKKQGYEAALTVIETLLAAKGIYNNAAKPPYFFTVSDPSQQSSANRVVNWNYDTTFQGANLIGAAFNLRLLQPGAGYVHNSTYSKRILYDTIDYLDDGAQNGTAATTLQNMSLEAYNYLVPRP
jgi:hypothetical protein